MTGEISRGKKMSGKILSVGHLSRKNTFLTGCRQRALPEGCSCRRGWLQRLGKQDNLQDMGLCPSLLLSAGVLCMLPQSLGIHLEDTASLKSSMTSGSCNLFPFLPYSSPSLRGWGFDEGIPFRPECSKVSHSLLCVNYHLLQEASLVRAE